MYKVNPVDTEDLIHSDNLSGIYMSNRLVTARTQKHFDDIALKLDWWARRNRYYYQDLDRLQ